MTVSTRQLTRKELIKQIQDISEVKSESKIQKNLDKLSCLQTDAKDAAFGAAELYRNLRKKGITIRKPNDCLIAFYAIHFDLMIDHIPLKIYQL
ncbi:MAG: hypothetical protein ACK4YV_04095 [Emticicia sp.]